MMTPGAFAAFVKQALGLEALAPDGGMGRTVGWDSFAHLELIAALEARFAVELPYDRIETLTTLAALTAFYREAGIIGAPE